MLVKAQAGYRHNSTFRQRATSSTGEHLQSPQIRVRATRHDTQDIFPKRRLKSEEKRGRRKPLASSLLSECLACHSVLVSDIFSRRRSRVRAMRPTTRRHLREPDTGRRPALAGGDGTLNGSRSGKSRVWRRRTRERFPLQRARRFTNRGAETGNVNAKPKRMQPRESKNAERSTCGGNGRQRSEL